MSEQDGKFESKFIWNMIKKDSTEFNRNAQEGNFMILY